MKITVLCENTAKSKDYLCEHGLSLYIETDSGEKILFDFGQTDLFAKNAKVAGVDLAAVDFCVLSHGHYDHGGGLEAFTEINETAPIFMSRQAFGDFFNGTEKYIGLDKSLKEKLSERIFYVDDFVKINENIKIFPFGTNPKPYENYGKNLKIKTGSEFIPDTFDHEIYAEIKQHGRKYLFSGCAHNGVLNIVKAFSPDIFIGGFHFKSLSVESESDLEILKENAEILKETNTKYYTCHCTGVEQYKAMAKVFESGLSYISAGDRIII